MHSLRKTEQPDDGPTDSAPGRGVKSAEAFRTISEVADELGVAQHVLRFWESKFPQVKPLKRGGGRRYYRPEDIYLLRGIQHLLYREKYTIKGVQKLLRERGARSLIEAMRQGQGPESWRQGEDAPAPQVRADGLEPSRLRKLQAVKAELQTLSKMLKSRS